MDGSNPGTTRSARILIPSTEPPTALEDRRFISGCAGALLDFPAREIPEESACWIPFDESVAIGWA
jgi:hypothetical protein